MTHERQPASDRALEQAVAELQQLIATHYPGTTFAVGPGGDDPDGTYLTATVDLDDPDEVMDLVIERVLSLQIEDGLPIHVVPVRTPERVARLQHHRVSRQHLITPPTALHP